MPESSSPPNPPGELYAEKWLAVALALPEKKIRAWRPASAVRQPDGFHWPLEACLALAKELCVPLDLPEKKTAPRDDVETVTVVSVASGHDGRHFQNPNIVQCARANGEKIFVRVVHSSKYRPTLRLTKEPMRIKARPSDAGNWWSLVGREPRFPAVW